MHRNMPYNTRLIFPHMTHEWQRATEIAKEIPELNAQEVAQELSWKMVNKYVECKRFDGRVSSGRIFVKKFRLIRKLTVREEALER